MVSHRSGETEDTFIADLVVGLCTGQVRRAINARAFSIAIYSQIALFFALNRAIFPANEKGTLRQNSQSDFKACLR